MAIDAYLVDTPAGPLRGAPLPDGGALFAGIPFVAPPTGPLRLRPPRPPRPWRGVRDATRFGPAPPQTVPALMSGARATQTPAAPGGACHGADLMLLFDRVDPGSSELAAVRDDLVGAWAGSPPPATRDGRCTIPLPRRTPGSSAVQPGWSPSLRPTTRVPRGRPARRHGAMMVPLWRIRT